MDSDLNALSEELHNMGFDAKIRENGRQLYIIATYKNTLTSVDITCKNDLTVLQAGIYIGRMQKNLERERGDGI